MKIIIRFFYSPFVHYTLLNQLCRREISKRYRGSFMGVAWAFFMPLLMLSVYSLVFVGIFESRWPGLEQTSKLAYSFQLFCGLMVFNFFSDVIGRAPGLIVDQPNLVKKVVFPLEILPFVSIGSAIFHFIISLFILIVCCFFLFDVVSSRVFLTPFILAPLIFLLLGLSWIISALGVYLRDVSIIIGVFINLMMFLSPIFYSAKTIKGSFSEFIQINPLTFPIESLRSIFFASSPIDWASWWISLFIGLLVSVLGAFFFSRARDGFSDVL